MTVLGPDWLNNNVDFHSGSEDSQGLLSVGLHGKLGLFGNAVYASLCVGGEGGNQRYSILGCAGHVELLP